MKLLQQLNQDINTLLKSFHIFLNSVRRDGLLASVGSVLPRLFQFRRYFFVGKDLTGDLPEPVSLPGITIRRATVEDIPLFLESLSHCCTPYDLTVLTQDIAAGRTYYIALEDGRIVHYNRILTSNDGVVYEVPLADGEAGGGPGFTAPEARRRGIAVNVAHHALRELADAGYQQFLGSVHHDNMPSLGAAEKLGLKVVGTLTYVRLFGITVFRKARRS